MEDEQGHLDPTFQLVLSKSEKKKKKQKNNRFKKKVFSEGFL